MPRRKDTRTKAEAGAFGKALKRLREDRGWSQSALAAKAEVSQPLIVYLESGAKQPGWDTVQALADSLECSTEDFR